MPAPSTMKVSAALLCLMLTAASVCSQEHAQQDTPLMPIACCFSITTRKIPINKLQSYTITSPQCSQRAVILKTKRGLEICADFNVEWVKDFMKYVDQNSQTPKA